MTPVRDKGKLEITTNNYLIVSTNPKPIIFDNNKSYKAYGQRIFNITDKDLNDIVYEYIFNNELRVGDYSFSLKKDKNIVTPQPKFSNIIRDVFLKVCNIAISLRFMRMPHTLYLLNKNPSVKGMEMLAYQMPYSLEEQAKYRMILK